MNLVDQYAYKYSTVVPRSAQHRRKIHGSRVGVAFSFLGCSFPHGEFVRQRRERRGVALGPWPSPSWAFAPRAPPHLFELEHTHPRPCPTPGGATSRALCPSTVTDTMPRITLWPRCRQVDVVLTGPRPPAGTALPCGAHTDECPTVQNLNSSGERKGFQGSVWLF